MKKTITIIILLLIIASGVVVWNYYVKLKSQPKGPAACTQEAKLCPDGSYVGRTGPDCEFAACPVMPLPNIQIPSDWLTFTDKSQEISFKYPATYGTKYLTAQNWPPTITISNEKFSCNETPMDQLGKGGEETFYLHGGTAPRAPISVLNNICEKVISEGAAGSRYSTLTFSAEKNGKLITLSFIERSVNCDNYPAPEHDECALSGMYNTPGIIDNIISSIAIIQ